MKVGGREDSIEESVQIEYEGEVMQDSIEQSVQIEDEGEGREDSIEQSVLIEDEGGRLGFYRTVSSDRG